MKLLLVEDNAELAHWVVNLLRRENFAIDCVGDGESADSCWRPNATTWCYWTSSCHGWTARKCWHDCAVAATRCR